MFAGPNGSGKSTIFHNVKRNFNVGYFINADEIEKDLKAKGLINLYDFNLQNTKDIFEAYMEKSTLVKKAKDTGLSIQLKFQDNLIINTSKSSHSYEAALIAGFLRHQLIEQQQSFSFETVMSHPSKLTILEKANKNGYRTYLYFICTDAPHINVERVKNRVAKGGHPVPENKIIERYYRSLDLLAEAIQLTYRTFLFDNSKSQHELVAEIFQGSNFKMYQDILPQWLKENVLDKLLKK